ncbi:MAG: hypothetical protein ACYTAS_23930, partial [Planctomycetota bacterium]
MRSEMVRTLFGIIVCGCVAGASGAAPHIIYVDGAAMGVNDGSSWADAYVYLQDALTEAEGAVKPIEIRVAQGVYAPDKGDGVTLGDRNATFQLGNGVTLKGGYGGAGAFDPGHRDARRCETILSGDLNADDVEVADPSQLGDEPTRNDNTRHIVTGSGTDATAVLDGFVVTGA